MLKPVLKRKIMLACLADCPADNHARQLALFLYQTLPTILRKILTIITLTFICACGHKEEIVNPNGLFSSQEIADLNYILERFDYTLLTEIETKSNAKAYASFSKIVFNQNKIPIYPEIEKLSDTLPQLSVFDEIWIKIDQEDRPPGLNLNPSQKYFKYLEKLGEDSELIKNYKERVEVVYDIQPSVIAGISNNFNDLNLKNPNYRLFLAIHYLTLINR